ncbi:MAG TPA: hypothetical protein VFZ48_00975 [Candidatus Saccharimonadales bacterium]
MSFSDLNWYQVSRLPLDKRCEVLAILLTPFADKETGELHNGSPQELLATILRGQIPRRAIPYLVTALKDQKILVNTAARARGKGPWFLHPPKKTQVASHMDAVYSAAIHLAAHELVERFGKGAIPDIVTALHKLR